MLKSLPSLKETFAVCLPMQKKIGKNQGSFEVLVGCQNIYERKKIKDYLFNLVILMK